MIIMIGTMEPLGWFHLLFHVVTIGRTELIFYKDWSLLRLLKPQRGSRRSQLVSTSNRMPSCDTLSNDQLMNCERQLSLS